MADSCREIVGERQEVQFTDVGAMGKAMHIRDLLGREGTACSFEFFPPKSPESYQQLLPALSDFRSLGPSFVSVTYGAAGTNRDQTYELVVRLKVDEGLETVPHVTCVAHRPEEIQGMLRRYAQAGVHNILALRGDLPGEYGHHHRARDAFQYAADLVSFIRAFDTSAFGGDQRGFGIGVAGFPEGHPQTPNRLTEMDHLKAKVDAGADYICTQLFFDNRDFYDFVERCELAGIDIPIIAGILPVTSISGLHRMAQLAGRARFPAGLLRTLDRCGDDSEAVRGAGVDWASEQCRDLFDQSVPGIHFYTLNRCDAIRQIFANLGLAPLDACGDRQPASGPAGGPPEVGPRLLRA